MNKETAVLIIGAGPCGLAAACELKKLGIHVRILDASPDRVTESRAIMLWPPALEVLDGIGLLESVTRRALRPGAYAYHLGSGSPSLVRFRPGLGPLLLQQDVTNGLLEDELARLGCHVERSVEVTEVKQSGDTVTVQARQGDGTELTIEADWLIGADGAHSTVRKQLGIEFAGEQNPNLLLLAEAQLDGELDRSAIHITVGEIGVLLAPLPGGDVRISGIIGEDTPLTAETVQRMLDERGLRGGLRVSELSMLTTFTTHERLAESMRLGRCFLVGDAAHMNSISGGQGLNLGLQDVHNLTWKLAGVISGRLDPAVLASYDPERRAAAEQVIRLTGRMIRQADLGPIARFGRDALFRLLCATKVLEREQIPRLAGRRIRYPDAFPHTGQPASRIAGRGRGRLPRSGTPAPEWLPRPGQDAYGMFRLITTGDEAGSAVIAAKQVAERWPLAVRHEHVQRPGTKDAGGFILIRPDGFVACSGPATEVGRAGAFLDALTASDARQPVSAANG